MGVVWVGFCLGLLFFASQRACGCVVWLESGRCVAVLLERLRVRGALFDGICADFYVNSIITKAC